MGVILATGITSLEVALEAEGFKRCYNRSVIMDVVKEWKSEIVILSPYLNGAEDIITEVVVPLREEGIRIIFLPGSTKDTEAIEWAKKLIPWGVYCYIFDPVTTDKIKDRINNPGRIKDLPHTIQEAIPASLGESGDLIDDILEDLLEVPGGDSKPSPMNSLKGSVKKEKPKINKGIGPISLLKARRIKKQPIKSPRNNIFSPRNVFCKTGYIRDGEFKKVKVNAIEELIQPNIEGIVIPAKWGYEPIKKYRRLSETKTIPLIVLNGDTQHILAGADRITPRISERIIQDVTAYSRQLKIMWETAIICSKTGLPKSEFYHTWFERQKDQKRIFSAAYFDLDKFSAVNDTYGHTVGDIVLYQFAQFLKNNTREQDIAIRWGGEEFVVILPDTNARQGYIMIDRLREMWAEKNIVLPDGQVLKSTFSAGVAQHKEHKGGTDVIDKADNLMYRAKNSGRNKVILSRDAIHTKIIILGNVPTAFLVKQGYQIVTDYKDADCIISDITTLLALPEGIIPQSITLYVLGTGKPSDFKIKRTYFDAMLFSSLEKIVNHIEGIEEEPITKTDEDNNSQALPLVTETKDKTVKDKSSKVTVLPGVRTSKTNLTLPKGGVVFIACPSRPAIASELASKLALSITNVALVCAAPESTAALNIGLTVNDLIESDWRFPRAIAPLHQAGVYVWPVDPYKHTNPITPYDVHRLIEQIKHKFNLVLVDCCGSLSYCSRVAHDEAIMVIKKEGDMSDLATSQWLTNYGGKNVLEVSPIETPIITEAENGLLIDTRSIDCKENS